MTLLRPAMLALLALLPLTACGGGASSDDPKALAQEGQTALAGGDHAAAQASFDAAVAVAPESDPTWLQASLGSIRAQAHTAPEQAKDRFLALAQKVGDRLKVGDYTGVASELAGVEGGLAQAAYVADAAKKAFPEHAAKLDALIAKLLADAKANAARGDSAGLDALKGLGYVGGGD